MIRLLWEGGLKSHRGQALHGRERPHLQPPRRASADPGRGRRAADRPIWRPSWATVSSAPRRSAETIERFRERGGEGKPTYGQVHVCWAESEEEARRTALEWWPNARDQRQPRPRAAAARPLRRGTELVEEDDIAESVVCGPDPQRHLEAIEEYVEAGYDHVYVHQIGPDQEGFFDFYSREMLPKLG